MSAATQYATFEVGCHYLGMPVLEVQEVLRGQQLTQVPLAPPVIAGLINVRGQIIPALEMRRLLRLPRPPTSRSLRLIPITGPASILAAISALVGIAPAAQQTRLAAHLGPQRTPRFWAAARLASITNSGASSSSARRSCSIGFLIPKTPLT